ncbi:hypothetical protein NL676_010550 [Syzygium grande]|nr:hypothetical protein NL676_010550 [Syzygium grande]
MVILELGAHCKWKLSSSSNAGPMAEDKVYVTVFLGGKFQVGPPLQYVGGRVDVVEIDLCKGLLSNIIEAVEALGGYKIEKLFYRVPGSSILEDGVTLRYLWDNSGVIDLLYHHLHYENFELYVEHIDDDETIAKTGQAKMETGGMFDVNKESVDNVADNVFENVIGNIDDDKNWLEVGSRDLDESDGGDACNLVDIEQLSDNDDFELVDAMRNLKQFSARHRLKTGTDIAATSQLDVGSPIELAADPLIVDDSGYEMEYYHSDDEESLHSGLDNKGEEEEDHGVSRRRSRGCPLKKANVCTSNAYANTPGAEPYVQSEANSIGSRPKKRQAKAIATTSIATEEGSKGQATASVDYSSPIQDNSRQASAFVEASTLVQNNSGQANASVEASTRVQDNHGQANASIEASTPVQDNSGQANAFVEASTLVQDNSRHTDAFA